MCVWMTDEVPLEAPQPPDECGDMWTHGWCLLLEHLPTLVAFHILWLTFVPLSGLMSMQALKINVQQTNLISCEMHGGACRIKMGFVFHSIVVPRSELSIKIVTVH